MSAPRAFRAYSGSNGELRARIRVPNPNGRASSFDGRVIGSRSIMTDNGMIVRA